MAEPFAKFWKCALQVNPCSYAQQYQGRGHGHGLSEDAYNEAIAEGCVKNAIQVVGIADHGSVEGVDSLRQTLESRGIVVFPGFEIASTEKVHLVCLYPAGTGAMLLNQYLGALGVTPGAARTAPSKLGCLAIAEQVLEQGGFLYAAHITGANGLIRLNQDGGGLTHIWCDTRRILAAQIPGDVASIPELGAQKILQNKEPAYRRDRPIALLNAKDVRKPADLDNERVFSWVKMTTPTLDALRLACHDPASRVRLSHEVNPAYYSRIEKIVVRRGYLEDIELVLSPNLNALVGGRGTGKSTLIEGLRYALQVPPAGREASAVHQGIVEANFSRDKAGVEITLTSFRQNSERYIVSRYYGEPAKVLDENGAVLQLSPRDVLPMVEIYGQNELLAIVKDDRAKAALLARFLPDDSVLRAQVGQLEAALRRNRQDMDEMEARKAALVEQLEALPGLLDREKSFRRLNLESEMEQVKQREMQRACAAHIQTLLEALGSATAAFEEAVATAILPALPSDVPARSLQPLLGLAERCRTELARAAGEARTAMDKARREHSQALEAFMGELAAGEQAFNVAVNKLPSYKGKSVAQMSLEYKRVYGDIARLQPLEGQQVALEACLTELRAQRDTLIQQLDEARNRRWSDLARAVKGLNKRLDGQIRVEFQPGRVRAPLKEFLQELKLEGVGEKRLSWIDAAQTLTIPELMTLIRQGADALMTRFKSDGMQRWVADALAGLTGPQQRALEEVHLPERMELLLNVAVEGENYREVTRLSTGQQCTAVLHLLLLDNTDPLIIDQPEDNLDNAFIANHIVNELRASKTRRQFLFATHNANIPVFGDAEWIGVLEEEEGRARLKAAGSIDSKDVKELAASILEGGREAFTRRREKYGI